MKRFISIALIFIMAWQCLYVLGMIMYFQLNRDYIAEVLCVNKDKSITLCYGQCFLDKNISPIAGTNQEKLPIEKIEKIEVLFFLVSHYYIDFFVCEKLSISGVFLDQRKYNYMYPSKIFQPPEL